MGEFSWQWPIFRQIISLHDIRLLTYFIVLDFVLLCCITFSNISRVANKSKESLVHQSNQIRNMNFIALCFVLTCHFYSLFAFAKKSNAEYDAQHVIFDIRAMFN